MSLPKKLEIDILTLFPGMFDGPLGESLIEKARAKGLLKIRVVDLRDFAVGRHRKADDKIFGGGSGMLLQVGPIWKALKKLGAFSKGKSRPTVIYLSPQGERLWLQIQNRALHLSTAKLFLGSAIDVALPRRFARPRAGGGEEEERGESPHGVDCSGPGR